MAPFDPITSTEGGLISFGIDQAALYRLAASYVDRIPKGEKPADLPVQASTKYGSGTELLCGISAFRKNIGG
jgi:ABC-type uncharacterized transport system substrate-binding protein